MDEIESVADNDEGKLVGQLGFLQKVLDSLWVVALGLPEKKLKVKHDKIFADNLKSAPYKFITQVIC